MAFSRSKKLISILGVLAAIGVPVGYGLNYAWTQIKDHGLTTAQKAEQTFNDIDQNINRDNYFLIKLTNGPVKLNIGPGPKDHYTVQKQPAAGTCHYVWLDKAAGKMLPDPDCTPGAISPAVTQANLASTICKAGYTGIVRPPVSVTNAEKQANAKSYSYTGNWAVAEYDHFVPLEVGGDPNDARNIFVEPNKAGAKTVNNPKDTVENALNKLVCDAVHLKSQHKGSATSYLPLHVAQALIVKNWTTAIAQAKNYMVKG